MDRKELVASLRSGAFSMERRNAEAAARAQRAAEDRKRRMALLDRPVTPNAEAVAVIAKQIRETDLSGHLATAMDIATHLLVEAMTAGAFNGATHAGLRALMARDPYIWSAVEALAGSNWTEGLGPVVLEAKTLSIIADALDGEAKRLAGTAQPIASSNDGTATDTGRGWKMPDMPLMDDERATILHLANLSPNEGATGQQILSSLAMQGIAMDDSSWQNRTLKRIRDEFGILNRKPGGYYLPEDHKAIVKARLSKSGAAKM